MKPVLLDVQQRTYPQHPAEGGNMFGLGLPELIIILIIVLIVFGAKRLPDIGAGIGQGIRNFKDATSKVDKDDQKKIDDNQAEEDKNNNTP
jgi:sec-independent protein translocase protein TatA